jgi:hypothetical protein
MCPHPACTGVHDNSRYRELCPAALDQKRAKDWRYYSLTVKGFRARTAKKYGIYVAEWLDVCDRAKSDPSAMTKLHDKVLAARYPGLAKA